MGMLLQVGLGVEMQGGLAMRRRCGLAVVNLLMGGVMVALGISVDARALRSCGLVQWLRWGRAVVVGVIDLGRMADGPLFLGPLAGVGALGLSCRLGKGVFGGFCALRFSWGVGGGGGGALDEVEQIPGGVRRWWGGGLRGCTKTGSAAHG